MLRSLFFNLHPIPAITICHHCAAIVPVAGILKWMRTVRWTPRTASFSNPEATGTSPWIPACWTRRGPTWRYLTVLRSPSQHSQQDTVSQSVGSMEKILIKEIAFRYVSVCFSSHLIILIGWEQCVTCMPSNSGRQGSYYVLCTDMDGGPVSGAPEGNPLKIGEALETCQFSLVAQNRCVDELCTVFSVLQCQGSLYHISPISASEHDSGRWKPAGYLWVSDSRLHVIKISQLWLMWCIPTHSKTDTMRNLDFTWGHMGPHISWISSHLSRLQDLWSFGANRDLFGWCVRQPRVSVCDSDTGL